MEGPETNHLAFIDISIQDFDPEILKWILIWTLEIYERICRSCVINNSNSDKDILVYATKLELHALQFLVNSQSPTQSVLLIAHWMDYIIQNCVGVAYR